MSVTTAGEQRRRAGAAPRRWDTARPQHGPWRAGGHRTPILTLVPPLAGVAGPPETGTAAPRQEPPAYRRPSGAGEPSRRPTPGAAGRPATVRVRLTRRGRVVVAVVMMGAVVLVAALAWLAGTARAEASGRGSSPGAVYHSLNSVIVGPGQSLWSIAAQAEPGADPRSVIQEIIDLNALHGMSVQAGQRLWVPRA